MAAIGLILLFVFLLFGMPVGFSLLAAGAIGLYLIDPSIMYSILTITPYRSTASFILTTVPLFILMAEFLSKAGFAKDLYRACYVWVGHLPGGLGIASILSCALMGSMSGSTTATAAAMTKIAIPEMDKFGYNRMMSTGVIAFGGTIAGLIPPSIGMIIYGIQTETSIGKLLIAGILPGIIMAIVLCLGIYFRAKWNPSYAPIGTHSTWSERFATLKGLWAMIIIIVIVIGSIYTGLATATESAALGVIGAVLLGIATRRLKFKDMGEALQSTLRTTSMIFTIIIGAMVFGYYMTVTGYTQKVVQWINGLDISSIGIVLLILLVYLVLGFFMDALAILLLTLPLTFPIVDSLGYDPIWFGVVVLLVVEIGLVTPPLGINVFVVSSMAKEPIQNVFKGVMYMIALAFVVLAIFILFPNLATWLPNTLRSG